MKSNLHCLSSLLTSYLSSSAVNFSSAFQPEACAQISIHKKENIGNVYLSRLNDFLEKYLYDERLNISFLSSKIGINAKYLFTIYKDAYDLSLLNDIHKKRIPHCKELLLSGISVTMAASMWGYNSTLTLNRWFKKYEGITPSAFVSLYGSQLSPPL